MAMNASSPVLKFVGTQSDSIVTDMAYDHHGRRLASVTADGGIRIYDLDDNGVWCMEEGCEIKVAHLGTLWKVDWAHPGFGRQLLATCSQDRTVKIWEEHSEAAPGHDRGSGRSRSSRGELPARGGLSLPRWMSVATLNDSDYGVLDVKFAPQHLGLRIASASEDGLVRVYKAADASSGGGWKLETSSSSSSTSSSSSSSSLSPFMPCPEGLGVSSISWCQSPFLKPLMVVGTMSGLVQIWRSDGRTEDLGKWSKVLDLPGHEARGVSSVRWSPQFCTSFDQIATCGGDGRVFVHRLERRGLAEEAWTAIRTSPLKDEKGETEGVAWSVGWDVNGSSLQSSDGNTCRSWVPDGEGGSWFCADSFQEVGTGTGVGDRKRMMMTNRQEDGMIAPAAAAAALASSSSTGAPLHPPTTVPEFFEG